jgi:hypothetical protein
VSSPNFGSFCRERVRPLSSRTRINPLVVVVDDAEPLYRRAIEIDEKILGKEHPDVATRYNNLAYCFRTRQSMPRPSRSIGARSKSVKRLSARSIPTSRHGTTIWPYCFRTRAGMTKPSRVGKAKP